jgi:hypothetical protein
MKGKQVVGKDGDMRKITIAFRPRDGRFEVADAAIRKDPEFLPDVTDLWNGPRPKPQIRRDLMNALRDKGRIVDEHYEDAVESNLDRAYSIVDYSFPTDGFIQPQSGGKGVFVQISAVERAGLRSLNGPAKTRTLRAKRSGIPFF